LSNASTPITTATAAALTRQWDLMRGFSVFLSTVL